MRWNVPVLAFGALAACEPVDVRFPEDDEARTWPEPPVDPVVAQARVDQGGVRACAAPAERDALGPYELRTSPNPAASRAYLWSGGLLAGDLDRDGLLDLLSPLEDGARLYGGSPSTELVDWDDRLASFDLSYGTGGSLADYDGDGDLDALVLRYDEPAVLLQNEGGHFHDATAESGLHADGPTTASTWGDVDRDGDLDLFVGAYGWIEGREDASVSWLFENRGDGTFLDRSGQLPDNVHEGYTRVAGFHDVDRDGYPELYVVNDVGSVAPNAFLRNVRGRLVPDGGGSGLDLEMSGGGLGVGDVNGDGLPDFLIPQWNDLSLMLSEDGSWFDTAQDRGLVPSTEQCVGWGAELADVDNDGDLDGIVAYGRFDVPDWSENPEVQPDALFLQQDDGTFVDGAAAWGVDEAGTGRGFVVADYDADGWLDLAKRELEGPSRLHLSRCGTNHWVEVSLVDPRPATLNRFGVGAVVEVTTDDGRTQVRSVSAGGTGFGSGGPPTMHFGLGAAARIREIVVHWPDAAVSVVGFGVEADQVLVVTRE